MANRIQQLLYGIGREDEAPEPVYIPPPDPSEVFNRRMREVHTGTNAFREDPQQDVTRQLEGILRSRRPIAAPEGRIRSSKER